MLVECPPHDVRKEPHRAGFLDRGSPVATTRWLVQKTIMARPTMTAITHRVEISEHQYSLLPNVIVLNPKGYPCTRACGSRRGFRVSAAALAASAFSLARRNALRRAVRAAVSASALAGPGAVLFCMAANSASALALSIFPTATSTGWLVRLTSGSWPIRAFSAGCEVHRQGVSAIRSEGGSRDPAGATGAPACLAASSTAALRPPQWTRGR